MQQQSNYSSIKISNWGSAVENIRFRNKAIGGVIVFILIMLLLPTFFATIESRKGIVLDDWILNQITPYDFSIPIFIIIWSTTILFIIRSIYDPVIFIEVIYSVVLLCIVRMISISLVPLDPPLGLIKLIDPLTSLTYGGKDVFITKDLFFSGHTSNMFLLTLCFQRKTDKWIGFFAAISVGVLVLFQHVHYTIDVLAAFVITYFLVIIGKRLAAH